MKHVKNKGNNFIGQVSFTAKVWKMWRVVRIICGMFIVVVAVANHSASENHKNKLQAATGIES